MHDSDKTSINIDFRGQVRIHNPLKLNPLEFKGTRMIRMVHHLATTCHKYIPHGLTLQLFTEMDQEVELGQE